MMVDLGMSGGEVAREGSGTMLLPRRALVCFWRGSILDDSFAWAEGVFGVWLRVGGLTC